MLEAVGFVYQPASGRWIHPEHGHVIRREVVDAHDGDWLAHWITVQEPRLGPSDE